MRIAIPVGNGGEIAEEFSGAGLFALYDVHDETRAVAYLGRQLVEEGNGGCSGRAAALRAHGVEVVMVHEISEGAVGHLLEAGVIAIREVPLLPPDALIAHLVSGTLQARPPEVAGGGCGGGGGGCGHCCGRQGQAGHQESGGSCATSQQRCGQSSAVSDG
jgi:predicted Fe-Mo cluster-binding NifX family protein